MIEFCRVLCIIVKMKTLLIDCDGVLYPTEALSMKDFVSAIQLTSAEFGISEERYLDLGKRTKEEGAKGVYNFMQYLAKDARCPMGEFKEQMMAKLDYSKITYNPELKEEMEKTARRYDIAIVSNNMRRHIYRVYNQVFQESPESMNVAVVGIEDTQRDGVFYPKQTKEGIRFVCHHLGKEQGDCTLIDDTQRNLDVARGEGLQTVLITPERNLTLVLRELQKSR
ncbi:MAG: HAD hydrolase-like protein [Alphaproteobacteria bacterium]|nr:HAD hydrolase-like protein [Alphaproteobacteria bacterium]